MKEHSLYKVLQKYQGHGIYPFHMPGHKRNTSIYSMGESISYDMTEIDGLDNLHQADGMIYQLEQKIAAYWGAKQSYILVGGSTAGNLAAIGGGIPLGGTILMGRNCHQSIYHAVTINHLRPIYILPEVDNHGGFYGSISPDVIQEQLTNNPDIQGVVITSPTYEGILSPIREIAEIVHEKGKVLIVDEAHGAHLEGHKGFLGGAVAAGADIVVQSLHKTLPAMTQTGVIHINNPLYAEKIKERLRMYQSSSPSYVLMASIDKCMELLEERGQELYDQYYKNLTAFYCKAEQLENINVLRRNSTMDMGKILIMPYKLSMSGKELYQLLLAKYKLQLEMAMPDYALAMTSILDTEEGFDRLIAALREIDQKAAVKSPDRVHSMSNGHLKMALPEQVMKLCEADCEESEYIELSDAGERISAGYITLYPPGIPCIVPGERIDGSVKLHMKSYLEEGLQVVGIYEEHGRTYVKVIR